VQTYAGLDEQPGYGPFIESVIRHTEPDARKLLGTYWSKGDLDELRVLMETAGLVVQDSHTQLGVIILPSTDALVQTEIEATPLAQRINESAYRAISEEARHVLAAYVDSSGTLRLPIRARFITSIKPG
jgi:hypothetical protein